MNKKVKVIKTDIGKIPVKNDYESIKKNIKQVIRNKMREENYTNAQIESYLKDMYETINKKAKEIHERYKGD